MLDLYPDPRPVFTIPLWPVFIVFILCLGDPDLLDVIIQFIGGNNCEDL